MTDESKRHTKKDLSCGVVAVEECSVQREGSCRYECSKKPKQHRQTVAGVCRAVSVSVES